MATSLIIITSRNMCCYGAYGLPNTLTGLRNVLLLLASYPTTALPGRDHLLPIEICIPFLNLRYAPPPSLLVFQKCAARPRPLARVSDIPPSLPPLHRRDTAVRPTGPGRKRALAHFDGGVGEISPITSHVFTSVVVRLPLPRRPSSIRGQVEDRTLFDQRKVHPYP